MDNQRQHLPALEGWTGPEEAGAIAGWVKDGLNMDGGVFDIHSAIVLGDG